MAPSPSGWYPNPRNAAEELYWDGSSWLGPSRLRGATHPGAGLYDPDRDTLPIVQGGQDAPPRHSRPACALPILAVCGLVLAVVPLTIALLAGWLP
ncbi:MAG TPA: hypothetical protein VN133_10260 [Humibacter sp.]|nr:hypothetical protein [Humibacter sp.]